MNQVTIAFVSSMLTNRGYWKVFISEIGHKFKLKLPCKIPTPTSTIERFFGISIRYYS